MNKNNKEQKKLITNKTREQAKVKYDAKRS